MIDHFATRPPVIMLHEIIWYNFFHVAWNKLWNYINCYYLIEKCYRTVFYSDKMIPLKHHLVPDRYRLIYRSDGIISLRYQLISGRWYHCLILSVINAQLLWFSTRLLIKFHGHPVAYLYFSNSLSSFLCFSLDETWLCCCLQNAELQILTVVCSRELLQPLAPGPSVRYPRPTLATVVACACKLGLILVQWHFFSSYQKTIGKSYSKKEKKTGVKTGSTTSWYETVTYACA